MEFLKEYTTLHRAINSGRIWTGENRVRKNLTKICKNKNITDVSLEESLPKLLSSNSEREIAMTFLIEILDDCFEHIKFKPEKEIHLKEYISTILSTYNSIKRG